MKLDFAHVPNRSKCKHEMQQHVRIAIGCWVAEAVLEGHGFKHARVGENRLDDRDNLFRSAARDCSSHKVKHPPDGRAARTVAAAAITAALDDEQGWCWAGAVIVFGFLQRSFPKF